MADPRTIREIAERNVKLLTLKTERGHLTGVTTARIEGGLRCVIEGRAMEARSRHAGQGRR
jgi:hypothetical protein